MFLPQLKRIRWAVRAALILGVAASVAANILHAQHNPISQAISAWPPLALLLTVELTSRIPMHKPLMAAVRVLATVAIAGIAAWVSYWHMQGVAMHYGETEASSYLLPVSVDGLIVVASVSLVELAGRIRMMEERKIAAAEPVVAPVVPAVQPVQQYAPVAVAAPAYQPVYQEAPEPARELEPVLAGAVQAEPWPGESFAPVATAQHPTPVSAAGLATASPRVPTSPLSGRPLGGTPANAPVSPALAGIVRGQAFPNGATSVRPNVTRAAVSAPPRNMVTSQTTSDATDSGSPRPRRPLLETADLADAIEAMRPEITPNELAQELGISPTRLRAVRREAREVRRSSVRR